MKLLMEKKNLEMYNSEDEVKMKWTNIKLTFYNYLINKQIQIKLYLLHSYYYIINNYSNIWFKNVVSIFKRYRHEQVYVPDVPSQPRQIKTKDLFTGQRF